MCHYEHKRMARQIEEAGVDGLRRCQLAFGIANGVHSIRSGSFLLIILTLLGLLLLFFCVNKIFISIFISCLESMLLESWHAASLLSLHVPRLNGTPSCDAIWRARDNTNANFDTVDLSRAMCVGVLEVPASKRVVFGEQTVVIGNLLVFGRVALRNSHALRVTGSLYIHTRTARLSAIKTATAATTELLAIVGDVWFDTFVSRNNSVEGHWTDDVRLVSHATESIMFTELWAK